MAITDKDIKKLSEHFATKKDLEHFATKKDLERFATKEEMSQFRNEVMNGLDKVMGELEKARDMVFA